MKKGLIVLLLSCVLSFTIYLPAASADELVVSAALSLKKAFEEIGKLYESKNKGTSVRFNFGASGDLARQIAGGAPVDVFASAAQKDMDDLYAKGLILNDTRADFVRNRVVLVKPKNSGLKTFKELPSGRIKRIAVGNPKTVPAGRYAAEVLDYYNITSSIQDKLIYAENVRQVLDYVARGEVDAGIVYATDAAFRSKEVRIAAEAPEASHNPAVYPIAVIHGTKNAPGARKFIGVVRSREGTEILKAQGFSIP